MVQEDNLIIICEHTGPPVLLPEQSSVSRCPVACVVYAQVMRWEWNLAGIKVLSGGKLSGTWCGSILAIFSSISHMIALAVFRYSRYLWFMKTKNGCAAVSSQWPSDSRSSMSLFLCVGVSFFQLDHTVCSFDLSLKLRDSHLACVGRQNAAPAEWFYFRSFL